MVRALPRGEDRLSRTCPSNPSCDRWCGALPVLQCPEEHCAHAKHAWLLPGCLLGRRRWSGSAQSARRRTSCGTSGCCGAIGSSVRRSARADRSSTRESKRSSKKECPCTSAIRLTNFPIYDGAIGPIRSDQILSNFARQRTWLPAFNLQDLL